jgi:hypothetical protein
MSRLALFDSFVGETQILSAKSTKIRRYFRQTKQKMSLQHVGNGGILTNNKLVKDYRFDPRKRGNHLWKNVIIS